MARLTANTVVTNPDTLVVTALAAGDEVPEWAQGLIGDHLTDEPVADVPEPVDTDEAGKAGVPDESWTVVELREHAKTTGIDLAGATTKADILAAING